MSTCCTQADHLRRVKTCVSSCFYLSVSSIFGSSDTVVNKEKTWFEEMKATQEYLQLHEVKLEPVAHVLCVYESEYSHRVRVGAAEK
jgi:hypothetical protein